MTQHKVVDSKGVARVYPIVGARAAVLPRAAVVEERALEALELRYYEASAAAEAAWKALVAAGQPLGVAGTEHSRAYIAWSSEARRLVLELERLSRHAGPMP